MFILFSLDYLLAPVSNIGSREAELERTCTSRSALLLSHTLRG